MRLVEAPTPEAVRGRPVTDFLVPEDLPFYREVIVPELARAAVGAASSGCAICAAGARSTLTSTFFTCAKQAANAPLAIAIVSQDIAARRRSEQRLRALVDAGAVLTHSLDHDAYLPKYRPARGSRGREPLHRRHLQRGRRRGNSPSNASPSPTLTPRSWRCSSVSARRCRRASQRDHPVIRAVLDGSSSLFPIVDDEWLGRAATSPGHAETVRRVGSPFALDRAARRERKTRRDAHLRPCRSERGTGEYPPPVRTMPRTSSSSKNSDGVPARQSRTRGCTSITGTSRSSCKLRRCPRRSRASITCSWMPPTGQAAARRRSGGDWYDAFALEDGRIVLTVGDVLGHGLHAAITMTKLRQAMQSAAMVNADPNVMLDVADKTLAHARRRRLRYGARGDLRSAEPHPDVRFGRPSWTRARDSGRRCRGFREPGSYCWACGRTARSTLRKMWS